MKLIYPNVGGSHMAAHYKEQARASGHPRQRCRRGGGGWLESGVEPRFETFIGGYNLAQVDSARDVSATSLLPHYQAPKQV
jgi:hypothetical protein